MSLKRIIRKKKEKKGNLNLLLESGEIRDIKLAKDLTKDHIKYYWDYYSELALQREQKIEEIKSSLVLSSISDFSFKNWQRVVRWKYSYHPLCVQGSIVGIGGRFNIGKGISSSVPNFPALYVGKDKDTSLQEALCHQQMKKSKLTSREFALASPDSIVIISVDGFLEKVVDLTKPKTLKLFFKQIEDVTVSNYLIKRAEKLNLPFPNTIKTEKLLLQTLLDYDWNKAPNMYDIPSNSQIFGHLVFQAGIEGILYPSKYTEQSCLAIFPENFVNTQSYISILDPPSPKTPTRVDSSNWKDTLLGFKEIEN